MCVNAHENKAAVTLRDISKGEQNIERGDARVRICARARGERERK